MDTRPVDDVVDMRTEDRGLRRKLAFWRRTAALLVGLVVLVMVVAWQRTTVRRRECRHALERYAQVAQTSKLHQEPAELLSSQWRQFERGSVSLGPGHYVPIVQNWHRTPGQRETLPLAICRDVHSGLWSHGRHVLFRSEFSMYVKWLTEEAAAPIAAKIPEE